MNNMDKCFTARSKTRPSHKVFRAINKFSLAVTIIMRVHLLVSFGHTLIASAALGKTLS
jgi:hypothetical protein